MSAILRIDRPASPGTDGRSRSDVVLSETITVRSTGVGTTHTFSLLASPSGSSASLVGGDAVSKDIVPDVVGTYRIRLDVDEEITIHTFSVLTVRKSLQIPAHNERASLVANQADVDPGDWVEQSETNEGADVRGYFVALEKILGAVDESIAAPGSSTVNALTRFSNTTGTVKDSPNLTADDLGNLASRTLALALALPPPSHQTGLISWDSDKDCPAYFNSISAVKMQIGRELWTRSINNTASAIPNGSVVHVHGASGGLPEIRLANARDYENRVILGVATHDIVIGGSGGEVTPYGVINDFDTSALVVGKPAYLSATVDGAMTSTRPGWPAKPVFVGVCLVSNAVTGSVYVQIKDDTFDYEFDGCAIERQETFILEDTGNIFCDVELIGGGNLPIQLNGQIYLLDCVGGDGVGGRARAQLTAGTSTVPEFNFIWVELVAGVPTLKAAATPPAPASNGFAFIAFATVLDAARTAAEGPLLHQRSTDAKAHDDRGRIAYIDERIRQEGARWTNGVDPTASIDTVPAPDEVDFSVVSGVVYQLHRQIFPALQVSVNGVYVANVSGSGILTPYQILTAVGVALEDSAGNSLSDTRFNWVVFGVINKTSSECKLFLSLPTGSYNTDLDAYKDIDQTAVISVPTELRPDAFLIARIPVRHRSIGGGTFEFINPAGRPEIIDLRGNPIGVSGSGASGAASQFSDEIFAVFDETTGFDTAFDCGTLTADRRYVSPDKDGTLALLSDVQPSLTLQYNANTTTTPPPASGQIRWDNATQTNAANIHVHGNTRNGENVQPIIANIQTGSRIYIFDDTDIAQIQEWSIDSIVDNTTYVSYGVTLIASNGADFSNNQKIALHLVGGGSVVTPGGSDTQVQFNDGDAFGGDAELTYDKTNKRLGISGKLYFGDGVAHFIPTTENLANIFVGNAAPGGISFWETSSPDFGMHLMYDGTGSGGDNLLGFYNDQLVRMVHVRNDGFIRYDSALTFANDRDVVDKAYVDAAGGGTPIGFEGFRASGSQAISSGVETLIQFPNVQNNDGGNFNTGTYQFTASTNEWHSFSLSVPATISAAGPVTVRIYQNGTLIAQSRGFSNVAATVSVSCSVHVKPTINDVFECRIFQVTGFSVTVQINGLRFTGRN